jgi:hypothetical protein
MEQIDDNDYKFNKIEKIIKDSYHPTSDELGNYILYINGIDPENKSFLRIFPKIELHLRRCSECNRLFLELNNEYSELDTFLNNHEPLRIEKKSEQIKMPVRAHIKYFNFKSVGLVLACTFLLYLGAFSVSKLLTPSSYKYTHLENVSGINETRGMSTSDDTFFYSYYLLGLAYLESAHTDIIGLFPSYDKIKVKQGISAFNKALELNNSGKFPNINLDIYFFIAKADLMLNNLSEAKENLNKVVNEKGSKINEAKKILFGLD